MESYIPGRVLDSELAVAEPEKSGGKFEEEMGGTRGEEGAEMGGEDMAVGGRWVGGGGIPSLWERGEWVWREWWWEWG